MVWRGGAGCECCGRRWEDKWMGERRRGAARALAGRADVPTLLGGASKKEGRKADDDDGSGKEGRRETMTEPRTSLVRARCIPTSLDSGE